MARHNLHRELRNFAHAHPLARLEALGEVGRILRAEMDAALFEAELALVKVARSTRPKPTPWRDIGKALGITGQAANRRYGWRLEEK